MAHAQLRSALSPQRREQLWNLNDKLAEMHKELRFDKVGFEGAKEAEPKRRRIEKLSDGVFRRLAT